jgi:hypothetical protein
MSLTIAQFSRVALPPSDFTAGIWAPLHAATLTPPKVHDSRPSSVRTRDPLGLS